MKSAFRPHFSRFSPFCSSSFSGGGSCELMFSTLPLASCRATFSAIESFSVDIFINGKTLSVRMELLDQESKFGQLIIVMICFGKTRFTAFKLLGCEIQLFYLMSTEAVYCFTPRDTFPSEKKEEYQRGWGRESFLFPHFPSLFVHFFGLLAPTFARYLDRKTHVTQANITGRDPFIQNSDRSDRKKWSTSKGGPVISKLFRLDRTDPLSFGPKFPEIRARSTDNIPFATLTVPIMQFVFSTKFCINTVFNFLLREPSAENLETKLMENYVGKTICIMGNVHKCTKRIQRRFVSLSANK